MRKVVNTRDWNQPGNPDFVGDSSRQCTGAGVSDRKEQEVSHALPMQRVSDQIRRLL